MIWLSFCFRFKWFWWSIDLGLKIGFEIQKILLSINVCFKWCWLFVGLNFKWCGCPLIWDSTNSAKWILHSGGPQPAVGDLVPFHGEQVHQGRSLGPHPTVSPHRYPSGAGFSPGNHQALIQMPRKKQPQWFTAYLMRPWLQVWFLSKNDQNIVGVHLGLCLAGNLRASAIPAKPLKKNLVWAQKSLHVFWLFVVWWDQVVSNFVHSCLAPVNFWKSVETKLQQLSVGCPGAVLASGSVGPSTTGHTKTWWPLELRIKLHEIWISLCDCLALSFKKSPSLHLGNSPRSCGLISTSNQLPWRSVATSCAHGIHFERLRLGVVLLASNMFLSSVF